MLRVSLGRRDDDEDERLCEVEGREDVKDREEDEDREDDPEEVAVIA
jgi:hypothetical protein